jgi:DnaJ-class molecular chaperone
MSDNKNDFSDFDDIFHEFFRGFNKAKPPIRQPRDGEMVCPKCEGRGEVRKLRKAFLGQMMTVSHCPKCNGTGVVGQK